MVRLLGVEAHACNCGKGDKRVREVMIAQETETRPPNNMAIPTDGSMRRSACGGSHEQGEFLRKARSIPRVGHRPTPIVLRRLGRRGQ